MHLLTDKNKKKSFKDDPNMILKGAPFHASKSFMKFLLKIIKKLMYLVPHIFKFVETTLKNCLTYFRQKKNRHFTDWMCNLLIHQELA